MKTFVKLLIASVSALVFLVIALACAGGDWSEEEAKKSLFDQSIMLDNPQDQAYQPYFRMITTPFFGNPDTAESNIAVFNDINVHEWADFFNKKITEAEISTLLYSTDLSKIDHLIFYIKDNAYDKIPRELKEYAIAKLDDKAKAKEFLYYLGFAKRCEPIAADDSGAWNYDTEQAKPFTAQRCDELITGGIKSAANVKNAFIRERYAFQICRLYYQKAKVHDQNYQACLQYYNGVKDDFKENKVIRYRSMGYAAAANFRQGKFAEANYLYSLMYDQCPEMKTIAQYSFRPQEESDFARSLALAKNTREKTVLWHLLGIYGDEARAIREIYALDPKSELLNLLLVRYVSTLEETVLPENYQWVYSYATDASPRNTASIGFTADSIHSSELNLIRRIADQSNTQKPYLWDLSCGYLYVLKNDSKTANDYFKKARQKAPDKALLNDQLHMLDMILKINDLTSISKGFEDGFAKDLDWLLNGKKSETLSTDDATFYIRKKLAEKYLAQHNEVKAMLCLNRCVPDFYFNLEKMDRMIDFLKQPAHSDFEKTILGLYPNTVDHLKEAEAILLAYQGKTDAAIAKMKESSGAEKVLMGNPFTIHINDCHDCDHDAPQKRKFTKLSFLEEIKKMEGIVATGKSENDYFLLANAFYNMTYFGNARDFYACEATDIETYGMFLFPLSEDYRHPAGKPYEYIFDNSRAEKYYLLARESATNPETKAKCTFMAAKCEQNAYYINKPADDVSDFKAGNYFAQLKAQFSDTKYYKEILKECGYFRTYVGR